ncbi:hypothetical protein D3C85_1094380 [compost metagenome]
MRRIFNRIIKGRGFSFIRLMDDVEIWQTFIMLTNQMKGVVLRTVINNGNAQFLIINLSKGFNSSDNDLLFIEHRNNNVNTNRLNIIAYYWRGYGRGIFGTITFLRQEKIDYNF